MDIDLGSWSTHLVVIAIFAFTIAGVFIYADIVQSRYKREVKGKIRAIIKRKTGWPLKVIVEPFSDGWVRVGKGDYKLPDTDKQKAVFTELSTEDKRILLGDMTLRVPNSIYDKLTEEERHKLAGDYQAIPSAMEWGFYPETTNILMKGKRVPIRELTWYENDPRPITWLRDREPEITSTESQAHTRQMDAQIAGVKIQELESQNKRMLAVFSNVANKTIVYGLLIAGIIISVLIFVAIQNGGLPLPGG